MKNVKQQLVGVILFLIIPFSVGAQCNHPDYDALIALYNSTGGTEWTNNDGWRDGEAGTNCNPCDGWFGIKCENNRVTCLDLDGLDNCSDSYFSSQGESYDDITGNNLIGTIPDQIGSLTNLKSLYFVNNCIESPLPNGMSNLINLQSLSLRSNQIKGTIPEFIGDLTSLTDLSLSNNQIISPLPQSLANLKNLQSLSLSFNQLSGTIPEFIGDLTSLEYLYIFNNQIISPLPQSLANLKNLQYLSLSSNQISGTIPEFIGELTSLRYLILSNNQFESPLPQSLANLKNLQSLSLYSNQISGTIPEFIGELTSLRYLFLSDNQIVSPLPQNLSNLKNLQSLSLSSNQISGTIPEFIGELTSLTSLFLGNNQFESPLPNSLKSLNKIQTIYLNENIFKEDISDHFSSYTELRQIYLGNNMFSGEILNNLSDKEDLLVCGLNNNQFTGTIPNRIGELPWLRILNISNNLFNGCIPESLRNKCFLNPNDSSYDKCQGEIFEFKGATYSGFDCRYDLSNNPGLMFNGDFERFCSGVEQLGAPCDDGDPSTTNDQIDENCECVGETTSECEMKFGSCSDYIDHGILSDCSTSIGEWQTIDGCLRESCVDGNTYPTKWLKFITDTSTEIIQLKAYHFEESTLFFELFETDDCNNIPSTSECYSSRNSDEIVVIDVKPNTSYFIAHGVIRNDEIVDGLALEIIDMSKVGVPCNDDNSLTTNDRISEDCTCRGESTVGCSDFDISLEFLMEDCRHYVMASIENREGPFTFIWRSNGRLSASDTFEIEVGSEITLIYRTVGCEKDTSFFFDPASIIEVGQECDDGNPNTFNDVIDENCECRGEALTQCNHPDFEALISLYNSTGGPEWTHNDGWRDGVTGTNCDPCNSWYGVYCQNNRVTSMDLRSNKLSGIIPEFIGDLNNLEELNLGDNKIISPLPQNLKNLSNLRDLFLFLNELTGVIPEFVGDLTELQHLNLGGNKIISPLPSNLENLQKLETLFLYSNQLSGSIPEFLGDMSSLQTLVLIDNLLSGCIPESLKSKCVVNCEECRIDLFNNPELAFSGDFDRFCSGESQIGRSCTEDFKDTIIPSNVITPNGDGQNDVLRFNTEAIIDGSELWIYNRWGDQIYHKKNYTNDWDANGYSGGAYFYVLDVNGVITKKTLTVLK